MLVACDVRTISNPELDDNAILIARSPMKAADPQLNTISDRQRSGRDELTAPPGVAGVSFGAAAEPTVKRPTTSGCFTTDSFGYDLRTSRFQYGFSAMSPAGTAWGDGSAC
ncbi:hypothetical protein KC347_g15 [Hortaea werneckii]|nr:hypothetical protein KC347_g15 [Hortaea werneckii]